MSGLDVAACLLLADAGLVLLAPGQLRLLLSLQGALLLLAALAAPATPALALTLPALLLGPIIIVPWRCGAFSVQPRRSANLVLLAAAVLAASLAANRVLPTDPELAAALLASLTAGIGGAALATGIRQAACLATAQNAALLGVLALTPPGPLPALLALLAAATVARLVPPGRTPA